MTDRDGNRHRSTLPPGKIRLEVWAKYKILGEKTFAAPVKEIISSITEPFVTAISDFESPRARFFNDKLLLVGDALTLFRPHLAQSTNQAATDCLLLEKVVSGQMNVAEWEKQVLQYAHLTRLRNNVVGTRHLSGPLVWLYYLLRYLLAVIAQRFGFII